MDESPILFDHLRVLLIEDSDNDALIIGKMLERETAKFKLVRTQNRSEMVEALKANVFDVILCDHDMPEFSSRGALEVRDELGLDLPFIIVTGAIGGEEVAIELMRKGVADFVPKHKMSRLLPAIKREIREACLRQAKRDADEALRRKNRELETTVETLVRTQDELVRSGRAKSLSRMAAGIAHDLNNSLNRIVDHAERLDGSGNAAVGEGIKAIRDAVDETINTVRRLSYFSDVHSRKGKGDPVDINGAVTESLELLSSALHERSRSQGKPFRITTNLREVPPVIGDEAHYRDAITSLVLNACDALSDGGELIISSYRITSAVVVEVEDDGIGMSDEILRDCLEPYFSTKREFSGGGGLAWVNALVERYGGVMRVQSREGIGTKVTLRFAIHDLHLPANPVENAPESRSLRIMVVDDERLITDSLAACLRDDNHFVKTAASGFEALELLRNETFDLMISDRTMPDFGGEELARTVRDRGDGVKFILATGSGDQLIAACAVIDGVDVILPKPITRHALRRAIHESGAFLSA